MKWITADEGYGEVPEFMYGLVARSLIYVVEVPRHLHGWTPNGLRVAARGPELKTSGDAAGRRG